MREALTAWLRQGLERLKRLAAARPQDRPQSTSDFDHIYSEIEPNTLQADDQELTLELISRELADRDHRSHHFLNFYSLKGGTFALERYGLLPLLRERGFRPVIRIETSDPNRNALRIYDAVDEPDRLLLELIAGFRDLELPDGTHCHMLFIEWLLMQDPGAEFPADRPPLPDQSHPGLGLFLFFGQMLRLMTVRLLCDGLMNHPAHYHNAFLYGKVMHFVDPVDEGRFQALRRDLAHLDLAEATAAVDEGRVRDQHGEVLRWRGTAQAMPITSKLVAYFKSPSYLAATRRCRDGLSFTVTTSNCNQDDPPSQ